MGCSGDSSGNFWMASRTGLVVGTPDGWLQRYEHVADDARSVGANHISAAPLEDAAGRLWIATRGGGLNRLGDAWNDVEWITIDDEGAPQLLDHAR